jgi:hypothetical protein
MKWTIRIELTPDGNPPITYDIGTISRPIADLSPEQIGLTLDEGNRPVWAAWSAERGAPMMV